MEYTNKLLKIIYTSWDKNWFPIKKTSTFCIFNKYILLNLFTILHILMSIIIKNLIVFK